MTFETIAVIVTGLYLFQVFIFYFGVGRPRDTRANTSQPFVSVVIAARNEEANLAECLEAILAQTYPSSLFEVILVDDNSTDGTPEICNSFQQRHANVNTMRTHEIPSFPGKTGALIQGIEVAKGDIVMITDADCTVPPTWIESTMLRYTNDVGIVGGMTLQRTTDGFSGMQSLDWAYLLGIASASASLRYPLSTIGNNLSFRRAAYDSVGGYRALPFSITEDYALFQAIIKTGRWDYLYPIDPEILVMSKPCENIPELTRQKHRWATGGLDMQIRGFLIMAVGFLLHVSLVVMLLTGHVFLGSLVAIIKCAGDYFFLRRVLDPLHKSEALRYFYLFEIYFTLYVIVLPFLVLLGGRVIWKERSY